MHGDGHEPARGARPERELELHHALELSMFEILLRLDQHAAGLEITVCGLEAPWWMERRSV